MAPYAFPHKSDDGVDEVMELQNTAHYSPNVANLQPISLLESINSVLHATKSSDANNNGSQTGSGNGLLNTPTGQGESEEESDLAVLLALFIPLAATVTAIFIIALFVRRMRRAESLHEVHSTTSNSNEFQMTPRKKVSTSGNSITSTMSSTSSNQSHFPNPSIASSHGKSSSTTSSTTNSINSHQPLDKSYSSASIYCNSSYLRLSTHSPIQHQSSLPMSGVSHSPAGRLPPPWPLAPVYTRSHYGLNKLHQQLYQHASLQAFSSVQSLNGLPLCRQYSDPQTYCTQSDPEMEVSTEDGNNNNTKKSSPGNKKLKRVLSAINFPRKIKQYQADRKRFNIYTIPMETREQLKHIYVY